MADEQPIGGGPDLERITAALKTLEEQQQRQRDEINSLKVTNKALEKKARGRQIAAATVADLGDETEKDPVRAAKKAADKQRKDFLETERPKTEFFSRRCRFSLLVFPDTRIRNDLTGLEDRNPAFVMEFNLWSGVGAELRDEYDRPLLWWGHVDLAHHDEILSGRRKIEDVLRVIDDCIARDPRIKAELMYAKEAQQYLINTYNALNVFEDTQKKNAEILGSIAPGAHKGGHFHR